MAKKKENRVPVSALETIMEDCSNEVALEFMGIEFECKMRLGFTDMMRVVMNIADGCIAEDGQYIPQAMEFMLRREIVNAYTNLTLPQNYQKQYDILFALNLYDMVCGRISSEQYQDIVHSANKLLQYRLDEPKREFYRKAAPMLDRVTQLSMAIQGVVGDIGNAVEALGNSEKAAELKEKIDELVAMAEDTPEVGVAFREV